MLFILMVLSILLSHFVTRTGKSFSNDRWFLVLKHCLFIPRKKFYQCPNKSLTADSILCHFYSVLFEFQWRIHSFVLATKATLHMIFQVASLWDHFWLLYYHIRNIYSFINIYAMYSQNIWSMVIYN